MDSDNPYLDFSYTNTIANTITTQAIDCSTYTLTTGGVANTITTQAIDCSTYTLTTGGVDTLSIDYTSVFDSGLQSYLPTVDTFNWINQPGFVVNLGDNDVHYTHREATEALKDHHNEKKLREKNPMLEKAYKEYKMLARLLQVEIEEDE